MSHPMPAVPGPNFQGMIDNALSVANGRLAALRKAHSHLLQKYTELEIKCIELQASHEMSEVDSPIGSQALNQYHDMHSPSESESNHLPRRDHNYNQFQQNYAHSEDSMSPHSSYTESSAFHGASGYVSSSNNPSSPGPMSPGFTPSKYSFGGQLSSDPMGARPRLRHQPSMPESLVSYNPPMTVSAFSDDGRSMKTVKSSTSSEKRARVAPQSDIRVRGRGGTSTRL
jgi:solute carrier family 25 protein 16